jgi:hypothetical protein
VEIARSLTVNPTMRPAEVDPLTDRVEQEILQVIYTWFREHAGDWPTFDNLDRRLNRHRDDRLDTAKAVKRISDKYLLPLNCIDGQPDPAGKLVLRVAGVARCLGSDDDTYNFTDALRWMVQQYRRYDPPEDRIGPGVPISAEQLAIELRLPLNSDSNCIWRLIALLRAEGLVSNDEYA